MKRIPIKASFPAKWGSKCTKIIEWMAQGAGLRAQGPTGIFTSSNWQTRGDGDKGKKTEGLRDEETPELRDGETKCSEHMPIRKISSSNWQTRRKKTKRQRDEGMKNMRHGSHLKICIFEAADKETSLLAKTANMRKKRGNRETLPSQ